MGSSSDTCICVDIENLNLHSDENLTDINDITGVLKLFFRELPNPLFTHELYHGFIDAASALLFANAPFVI